MGTDHLKAAILSVKRAMVQVKAAMRGTRGQNRERFDETLDDLQNASDHLGWRAPRSE